MPSIHFFCTFDHILHHLHLTSIHVVESMGARRLMWSPYIIRPPPLKPPNITVTLAYLPHPYHGGGTIGGHKG